MMQEPLAVDILDSRYSLVCYEEDCLDREPPVTVVEKIFEQWTEKVMDQGIDRDEEKPIWFAPWNGSFLFWFRGTLFSYRSYTTTTAFRDEEHITIKCMGRSGKIFNELIAECRSEYLRHNHNKTTVFKNCNGFWKPTAKRDLRPLSSVIIHGQKKDLLDEDLRSFREPSNRAKYSGHHIPYRPGDLLYGPPGTGKSSLTAAIAGQCKLDIYIVDIPSLTDERLRDLFNKLPRKCIVLLEDIDAVGADRENRPY